METTTKLNRDGGYTDALHGGIGIESMGILPVALDGGGIDRFIVEKRLVVSRRVVKSEIELTREQATWLRDRLTDVLNETDPAYQAWVAERENDMKFNPDAPATVNPDQLKAYEAMVAPALPATDDEWKARLAEGCKS